MSESKKYQQLSLLDFQTIVDKVEQSTASVRELRVPIFLPVGKLTHNSTILKAFRENDNRMIVETSWGKCEIRGRTLLTQVHRDILDCIMSYSKDIRPYNEDEILVLFSQTRILDEYSVKTGTVKKNTVWLKEKIQEIRDVTINPLDGEKITADYNIIRSVIDASSQYGSFGIILDRRYIEAFRRDLTINYEKILPDLLKVKNPAFQSIIRWYMTHSKEMKHKLDTVLRSIAFPMDSPQMVRKIKKELREGREVFYQFGIEYNPIDQTFYYRGNESIGFIKSLLMPTKLQGEALQNSDDNTIDAFIDEIILKLSGVEGYGKIIGNKRWRQIFRKLSIGTKQDLTTLVSYLRGEYGVDRVVESDRLWMSKQKNFDGDFEEKVKRAQEYRERKKTSSKTQYTTMTFPRFCAHIKKEFAGKPLVTGLTELGYLAQATIFVKSNGHLYNDMSTQEEVAFKSSEEILNWLHQHPEHVGDVQVMSEAERLSLEIIGKTIKASSDTAGGTIQVRIVDVVEVDAGRFNLIAVVNGEHLPLGKGTFYTADQVRTLVKQNEVKSS